MRKMKNFALESLPDEIESVDDILQALKDSIKPEISAVVEGKLMALRLEKGNFTKYTEQAEKLSEAFRRSLVVEGIPKTKAKEMTIKKTVELCRKTATSEIVKSVLSAASFLSPKEVIAKFVTENDIVRREKRESDNNKNAGNKFNNNFQNNRGNYRGNRGNFRGNRGFQNNNRGNFNNNGNSNRGGFNGNYRGNDRGNFRGQNRGGHRGNTRGNYNNYGNNNQNQNEHVIRFVSGQQNGQQQQIQQNQGQNEQVFRLQLN